MRAVCTAIFALVMAGCSAPRPEQLTVAAASNLAGVFDQMAQAVAWGVRHIDHLYCAMSDKTRLRQSQMFPMRGGVLEATFYFDELTTEVIADGSIHVYAPLRGRALAGASGNAQARIFSLAMEAELVSIAGKCVAIAVSRSASITPAPGVSTSSGPETGKAATGVPQASASIITSPNVSVRLGKTNTSAPA